MKRLNNLYQQICSLDNLQMADAIARKGKAKQPGVIAHDKNRDANILALHESLFSRTYRTSEYVTFKVFEPKEREVYRLPFFPDRICHHAVMNILEPIFVANFTADTYSCIKGKGIHAASMAVRKAMRDVPGTQYCLKLDIKKFYQNIDHDILKQLLRRKFKDQDLLWLLDEVIASAAGVPIGNYLSQYFANFYLSGFDHWVKEVKRIKYYFRYADDIVIFADNKASLHQLLADIRHYFHHNLKLTIKQNYQVFPVGPRPVDFVGYQHYHGYVLMRDRIKKGFVKAVKRGNRSSIAAYLGWAKHCNSRHLIKKLFPHEQLFTIWNQHNSHHFHRKKNRHRKLIRHPDQGNSFQDRNIEVSQT